MLRDKFLDVSLEEEEKKLKEFLTGLTLLVPEKEQIFQFYQGVAKKTLDEVKALYDKAEGCLAMQSREFIRIDRKYLYAAVFFRQGTWEGEPCWEMFGYHPYRRLFGNVVVELLVKRLREKKKMPVLAILEGSETSYATSFRLAGFSTVQKTEQKQILKIDRDWTPITGML